MKDTFGTKDTLTVDGTEYQIRRLTALEEQGFDIARLPYSLRILLENLLRREDGETVPASDIEAVANWDPKAEPSTEIAFMPARVILQDFTGVPALVDLAAMRDAMEELGGDPSLINPVQAAELVIDHSVQVDAFGSNEAFQINAEYEFRRNKERYAFMKWGQNSFENFRVVPPATGIVHQVNLEHLGRVVMDSDGNGTRLAYPDSLVGTDSHTTMINGLGILGWGVGGIEAEAAMLGQPISMLIPQCVGFRLKGSLPEGATATDLVLRVVEMLRQHGVVGKFVEFFGPGLARLPLADRATIANMAPEYGATCGIFPVDQVSLDYMELTGRSEERIRLVEAYMKKQGLFHTEDTPEAEYTAVLELDLGTVEPSLAGPKRPQDRIPLSHAKPSFCAWLKGQLENRTIRGAAEERAVQARNDSTTAENWENDGGQPTTATLDTPQDQTVTVEMDGETFELGHGDIVIAAITSCTNTSNPSVMVGAGLLAKKAHERGMEPRPWVKTSLAPGSKVVTEYLEKAGLMPHLEALKFNLVGYGCTTCIGNSGPLPDEIVAAVEEGDLFACSILSGNRNFEGRISPHVRANYLASPPLVVAYALAGRIDIDLATEPLGQDAEGEDVYLKDIWPSRQEIDDLVQSTLRRDMFTSSYDDVFKGDDRWQEMEVPTGATYAWSDESTYIKQPPYFLGMSREAEPVGDLKGTRVLALVGDSVTTDHISPAGAIAKDSPAGRYLQDRDVRPLEFNSYGSRRGNHEVMMRGTFANIRLRNKLVPGVEGGFTLHLPDETEMSIFEAAMKYREDGVPLMIIAGTQYGTGSSRDWAAKGPALLGVDVVIARSYERIHRSNLLGMGVLPLEFKEGESPASLGLNGKETYDFVDLEEALSSKRVEVTAHKPDGTSVTFEAKVRLDTPKEVDYYRHGGILQYVLRQLVGGEN